MLYRESAMKVRQNLGELINKVRYQGDAVIITKADKPVAAIIDIDLFEKIRRMRQEFERLSKKIATAYQDVPVKVAQAEVSEAVTVIRHQQNL